MKIPRTKVWRESQGLTLRELGDEASVAYRTIYSAEGGHEVQPSTARKIAKALGITVADLMEHPPVPLGAQPTSAAPSLDFTAMFQERYAERRTEALENGTPEQIGRYLRDLSRAIAATGAELELKRRAGITDEEGEGMAFSLKRMLGLQEEAEAYIDRPAEDEGVTVVPHGARVPTGTAG